MREERLRWVWEGGAGGVWCAWRVMGVTLVPICPFLIVLVYVWDPGVLIPPGTAPCLLPPHLAPPSPSVSHPCSWEQVQWACSAWEGAVQKGSGCMRASSWHGRTLCHHLKQGEAQRVHLSTRQPFPNRSLYLGGEV